MAHFAQLDENNVVVQVICAGDEYEANGEELYAQITGKVWKRTSYNSFGGVHYGSDGNPDGKPAFRKNYAGIGFTYSPELDAFLHPQPYLSWILDVSSCLWKPPIPYPEDGKRYIWSEATQSWVAQNV